MANNKLYIIFGLPGSGKSTFASHLAKAINAKHYNTDIIRHQVQRQGQYSQADKAMIYQLLLNATRDALQAGTTVVVDGTFYLRQLRRPFWDLAKAMQLEIRWIEMKANEEAIRERTTRKRTYSEANFDVYRKVKAEFEPLCIPHLELDTTEVEAETLVKNVLLKSQTAN